MTQKVSPSDALPVAVDVMGGDHKIEVLLHGIVRYLQRSQDRDTSFLLTGNRTLISKALKKVARSYRRYFMVMHTTEQVTELDSPSDVFKNNRHDSSMRQAVLAVADGKARACVSAGNSGALMSVALRHIGLVDGLSRPAFCCRIPTKRGFSYMLDVGANLFLSPQRLYSLAKAANRLLLPLSKKRLSLLNIGSESTKGGAKIIETDALLRQDKDLNYIGYIEPNNIYTGDTDIILCDGFVGNMVIKSIEGTSAYIMEYLRRHFLLRLLYPIINRSLGQIDPRRYNGALFFGLNGLVVASHAAADVTAFSYAIDLAAQATGYGNKII